MALSMPNIHILQVIYGTAQCQSNEGLQVTHKQLMIDSCAILKQLMNRREQPSSNMQVTRMLDIQVHASGLQIKGDWRV